ncbi:putative sterigmatocystin biosynthesis monooxygenase stcW [Cyphellophora attinorum]|uniref:Putative sterigmatocystin biosynthesis monooxygenase stcW n=1 Tax=Cyphellophora attinorum TaxID=1664694 RepID=A0A0N1NY05_9EURO|nr:putative sterigmatocystin biosynthesis monooxygenase stcW [Phialophora attinorum]KPI36365.1 putative sterigmatocystin biosynthesis monooxygenase stcW [Phialophora attinorum]
MAPSDTAQGTINRNNQYFGDSAANIMSSDSPLSLAKDEQKPYEIREQPFGTKKRMRIVIMGAGVSGLNFFKQSESKLENVEVQCYEKNNDVGGTWLENRYAGCACDIPSVNYQYSWKPAIWSKYYSEAPEIWQYLKSIEQENDFIRKYVKLRHTVQSAEWTDATGRWAVCVRDDATGETSIDHCDVFLNGGGVLNNWKWPQIPGLHDFKGKLMHSANWDQNYDFTGKRIAVIGAGSSGVQIVASLYDRLDHLYTWVRSPTWITAGFAQDFAAEDGKNFSYSAEQKEFLRDNPDAYLAYRKMIEKELNQRFSLVIKCTDEAKAAKMYSDKEMRRRMEKKPQVAEAIIPRDFAVGCRRPTPGNGYLEALTGDKTTCFTQTITGVTPRGFVDGDGNEYDVDAIVCATGFDTSWIPRFPLSVNGADLRDTWRKEGVISYLSVAVPGVPNYFSFCGPYGPLAHGSFFPIIERYTGYIIDVVAKMQTEGIQSLTPRKKIAQDFMRHSAEFLKRTAWTDPCSSWFKNGQPEGLPTIFPGSRVSFLRLLSSPRYEDYDVSYDSANTFAFLGNGFAMEELDGSDMTYYLGRLDADVDIVQIREKLKGTASSVCRVA